jgi:molybdate transport repressor ModE-like protein
VEGALSNIEVRQLRVLVAIHQHGGLTAAAQALGIAQSTASEAVAGLERAVGTPMVRRGRRGDPLTEAGHVLLPHARDVLDRLAAAQFAVAQVSTEARTSIAIASNESIGTYFLPRVLPAVRARWPNTRFAVTIALCHTVREAIAAGEADLGLLLGDGDGTQESQRGTGPRRRVLGRAVAMRFFAQPGHPLVARAGVDGVPRDWLNEFPLFISDGSGDLLALVRQFFDDEGLPGPSLEISGTVEGVKRGVAGDVRAVGFLADYALRTEIAERRVAVLRTRPAVPHKHVLALTSNAASRHPAVTDLLDELSELFVPPRDS